MTSASFAPIAHDPGGKITLALPAGVAGEAIYGGRGDCYRYVARYRLTGMPTSAHRRAVFILMNPSTATHQSMDPTVAKCWRYARRWGCDHMTIGNVFAYRATDQMRLAEIPDPVGPLNDGHLFTMCQAAEIVVVAYGTPRIPALCSRGPIVARRLLDAGTSLNVLALSQSGRPKHPLYLLETLVPQPWEGLGMAERFVMPAPRLTVPQVAGLWGCTKQHVYALVARGELGHIRIGTLIRVRVEDIEKYEASQCHDPELRHQNSASPNGAPVGMSSGGKGDVRTAFQQAQRMSAKRAAS